MTPLNPAYVDLVESSLAALVEEYPEMDGYYLIQCEWAPSAGGIEECWRQLEQRHGLAPQFTYDKLIEEAGRSTITGSASRSVDQTKASIVSVRLLDQILNERSRIGQLLPLHTKIYTSFIGHTMVPALPHIFDAERLEFEANLDYLASDAVERVDSLKFAADTDFKVHLGLAVNDDNVGFLPQYTTKVIDQTLRAMRRNGVSGYMCRLYETSKYECVLAHLAAASWDGRVSPRQTCRVQTERVCGPKSVAPMLKAYELLEAALEDVNQLFGAGFMMPHLLTKYWMNADDEDGSRIGQDRLKRLQRRISPIEMQLERARAASRPAGERFAADLLAFIRFVSQYLQTIRLILKARRSYDAAHTLRTGSQSPTPFDLTRRNAHLREAVEQLDGAVESLEGATRHWADCVRDAADRGSLVGLNVYGLDWLRGKADEVRLESELWSMPAVDVSN